MPKPSQSSDPENSPDKGERKQHRRGLSGASLESVAPKKRRQFAPAERLRLLNAADAALATGQRGALQALMRREGIYSSHLFTWRRQLAAGGAAALASQKPGRKPKLDDKDRQLLALSKRNAELERKLLIANALIDLQKNTHERSPTSWKRNSAELRATSGPGWSGRLLFGVLEPVKKHGPGSVAHLIVVTP